MTETKKTTGTTLIPILDYIWKKYLTNAQDPTSDEKADISVIMKEIEALKGKREAIIEGALKQVFPAGIPVEDEFNFANELQAALENMKAEKQELWH